MHFSKNHKKGVIQLAVIIALVIIGIQGKQWLPNNSNKFLLDKKTQAIIDKQICDYKTVAENKSRNRTFYVNSINDYSGYLLGLTTWQIDTLLSYQEKKKIIYNFGQFSNAIKLNTNQIKDIKDRLKFPKIKKQQKKYTKKNSKKFDLNKITYSQLTENLKISSFISKRIINFRKYLKGFRDINQIEDVYNINTYQIRAIKDYCFLKNPPNKKFNINLITQKNLSKIPYITWNNSKQIKKYIKTHGKLNSFEILRKFEGLSNVKVSRLPLYLTLE